jgi:MFS family permease
MGAASETGPAPARLKGTGRAGVVNWVNVVLAALLMAATLPGRTQGLGLITEPLLRDLGLDRVVYADINLWATLLGAAFCLPAGWLFDRFGLRRTTVSILLLLGAVVWRMSALAGSFAVFFVLVLLTRGLGQSALSVASLTIVGKSSGRRVGLAMGVYSALVTVFFVGAFQVVGHAVIGRGWRRAWQEIACALLAGVAPLTLLLLREARTPVAGAPQTAATAEPEGLELGQALRASAFWVFGGATALYGLAASGLGLFNQAVLAERGFDPKTYYSFLSGTTAIGLAGQLFCGWLSTRWPMQKLLALAMALYALGLAILPLVRTIPQLWLCAVFVGLSGGMITVLFFAVWSHAFGPLQLGRIQGAAQMLTVFASAAGPLLFARCFARFHSYTPALWLLAPVVLLLGGAALRLKLPQWRQPRGPRGPLTEPPK